MERIRAPHHEALVIGRVFVDDDTDRPTAYAPDLTINRILTQNGLVKSQPRKRPRDSSIRFERPGSIQLWDIDIGGGIELVNPATGEVREAKVVTGVDDHSRSCVMAAVVVERATGRAACLAFAEASARHGVPEEVIADPDSPCCEGAKRSGRTRHQANRRV